MRVSIIAEGQAVNDQLFPALLIAYCLLLIAYCLLLIAYCLLLIAYCKYKLFDCLFWGIMMINIYE